MYMLKGHGCDPYAGNLKQNMPKISVHAKLKEHPSINTQFIEWKRSDDEPSDGQMASGKT